ncbi:MAG: polyphenol oxidase family protein [Deltaproteobacteria bacterium]|jgi:YfiH family protein|nr:polyphenol oxidase family protein [Deltaproteobacteria bacterium]
MEKRQSHGLTYYVFELLAPYPRLRHGVFARYAPPELTGELTFAFGPNVPQARVLASLDLAAAALGLPAPAFARQTHSAAILFLDPARPYQPRSPETTLTGYDALVSPPGQSLLIKLADCQGILLFHPASGVLALAHSGWRGSTQNILGQTVAALQERLGLNPAELLAAVTPSLGPCCAEFVNYRQELPEAFWPFQNPLNHHFDFWAITRQQLTQAGLRPQNIEIAGLCTKCHPDFYSYRRGDTGRFALLAGTLPD